MTKPSRFCYRAMRFEPESVRGDGRTLEGYAAVFGEPTRIESWEGTFDEQIAPGAFRKTLSERTPVLQFDHGHDPRTGTVPIGAIQEIREDDHGLFVSARLFDNEVVEPIRQAIEGGAIDGMSFRFRVLNETWQDRDGKPVKPSELDRLLRNPGARGPLLRTIREVELFELGPVVFPAYEATTVGVRSLLAHLSEREREALLRELIDELRAAGTAVDGAVPAGEDAAEQSETPRPVEPESRSGPLPPLDEWLANYRRTTRASEPA